MKKEAKITSFESGLIWFGAAVSIAEILTGTMLAQLGISKAIAAVLLGHTIGGILMYLTGLIGAKTGLPSMASVQLTFGRRGGLLFSLFNSVQLVGWTATMIFNGANASATLTGTGNQRIWCGVIAGLIMIWILVGLKKLGKLNTAAMSLLLLLTLALTVLIFMRSAGDGNPIQQLTEKSDISFGIAVEMSAAMTISWLPLISDYTCNADKPKRVTMTATVVYFLASCWMFIIGIVAAALTGESDISKIMMFTGLGVGGLLIIIFSTVTTTFLDVNSAAVSIGTLSHVFKEKITGVVVCAAGALIAMFAENSQYEYFLYTIASIFAPMAAVQITDYYIVKRKKKGEVFDAANLISWLAGFILYMFSMNFDTPVGYTFPVMIATGIICVISGRIANLVYDKKKSKALD